MRRAYEVMSSANAFGRPEVPPWPPSAFDTEFRSVDRTLRRLMYAAYDGDAMLGAGAVFLPLLDNTHLGWLSVFVDPRSRRRGVGGALVEHLVEVAWNEGRRSVLVNVWLSFSDREHHPYRRFAECHGFTLATFEVRRRLTLPVPDRQIEGWISDAAVHHLTYRIATFSDPLPDALLPSACHVTNQLLVDAPHGDIEWEAQQQTPQTWREYDDVLAGAGNRRFITVALDACDSVVAYSGLTVYRNDLLNVHQGATLVLSEHRGHRLGIAVKAANLRQLQQLLPDAARVWTSNDETNRHMTSINQLMGFTPVELGAQFQRGL